MDINTLSRDQDDLSIGMNDIARIQIRTTKPLFTDAYRKNRITGSVILIDEATNNTVAAGMVILIIIKINGNQKYINNWRCRLHRFACG